MRRFVLSLLILVSFFISLFPKNYISYISSQRTISSRSLLKWMTGYTVHQPRDILFYQGSATAVMLSVSFFPLNKFPEQKFAVDIKGKDRGYLLKNLVKRGWGLFDLQTLTIQMALPDNRTGMIKTEPRDDISPFTEILSKAANDPSLKERPIAVKMEDKPATAQSTVLKEVVKPVAEPVIPKQDSLVLTKKEGQPAKTKQEPPFVINKTDPVSAKQDSLVITKKDDAAIKQKEQGDTKQEPSPVVSKTEPPSAKPETAVVKTEKMEPVKDLPVKKEDPPVVIKEEI
ncbi:MAG: hypothetical protein WDO16_09125 [Bacteroidota bacterium]